MFNFFKKKNEEVVSPMTGICIRMEEVPDKVFSTKMMGDGFAVVPSGDTVVAPVSGEVVMIADTKHAFGIKTRSGMEILVHIGLDTVNLNGEGFQLKVQQGSRVKAGEPVVAVDRDFMEQKGINMTTMTIFTGGYDQEVNLSCYGQQVEAGQAVIG